MDELNNALPQAETGNEVLENNLEANTTPTEQPIEQNEQPTPQTLKLKYNHEEKEIPLDEAIQLAQKGMNYEKAIQKTKEETYQQARDAYIAEQNLEWMGKPIKTEAEYKQAIAESQYYEKMQEKQLPEEVINELLEGKRDREHRKAMETKAQQEQQQRQEFLEFYEQFPGINPDQIPDDVWKIKAEKGLSLSDAYVRYDYNKLKSQSHTANVNATNAENSTGSVTGHGDAVVKPLTADMIEHMSPKEISSRWDEVKKVFGMK